MFKEYMSRSDALHNQDFLIFIDALGGIIAAVGLMFFGGLKLIRYFKRKQSWQRLDLPLGLLLCIGSIRVSLVVIAIWHHYGQLIALTTFAWGLITFWALITALRSNALIETYDFKMRRKKIEKILEESKEILQKKEGL